MSMKLLINAGIGETRAVFISETGRMSFACFRDHEPNQLAARYVARVKSLAPEMDGAFLDLGHDQSFLPTRAARKLTGNKSGTISDCVQEGQIIAVEISRNAIPKDDKVAQAKPLISESKALPQGVLPGPLVPEQGPLDQLLRWPGIGIPSQIIIDDAEALAHYKERIKITHCDTQVELQLFKGEESIFDHFGVTERLGDCVAGHTALPGGGWVRIEATAALTAIDVNGGNAGSGRTAAETALRTNIEAATMIADDIQFQDIGGLIVIDFIDMADAASKTQFLKALDERLALDPLHVERSDLSRFGLVEIRRQRLGPSLAQQLLDGPGSLRADVAALGLLRAGLRASQTHGPGELELNAPENVLGWLKMHGPYIQELERRTARRVTMRRAAEGFGEAHIKQN